MPAAQDRLQPPIAGPRHDPPAVRRASADRPRGRPCTTLHFRVGHRPAGGPGQRGAVAPGQPRADRAGPGAGAGGRSVLRDRAAAGRAQKLARGPGRRPRAGPAHGGAQRRGGAGRGPDGGVHRAGRGGRGGARLPARGRARQPRRAGRASCPTRCCSPGTGSRRRRRCPPTACTGTAPPWPGRPTVGIVFYRAHAVSGNTALRRRARRRGRGARRERPVRVLLVAARGRARGLRTARRGRRADRHRARRRAGRSPGRRARAGTTTPGTWARSPRWTCRCCRRCA